MVIWHKVAGFLVIGYLSMTRSFAYLGVPPLKLFIGEIVLAAFICFKPRVAIGTLVSSLIRPSPLNALSLALMAFVAYGAFQVGRGVLGGASIFETLKYFVFNYYTLYLILGLWVGVQAPDFLPKLVRVLAWVVGVYGLAQALVLKSVAVFVPGTIIPLFGMPGGGAAVAILGLLCFERNLAAVWPVLALNMVVTMANQVRAEWLGIAVGALVWGLARGQLRRVAAIGVAGLAVIGVIELSGVTISGRGSPITLSDIISRVIAPIDIELAEEFSPRAASHAGTMVWREKWWEQIWRSARSTPILEAIGHGYGFDLFSLAPTDVRKGQAAVIRTPHNVFYYALGYTGWVGVIVFAAVQLAILQILLQAFRLHGEVSGIVWWSMGVSISFFSNFFETPFGAVPFYLLLGMSMAPALQPRGAWDADLARSQLLSAARR